MSLLHLRAGPGRASEEVAFELRLEEWVGVGEAGEGGSLKKRTLSTGRQDLRDFPAPQPTHPALSATGEFRFDELLISHQYQDFCLPSEGQNFWELRGHTVR